MTKIDWQALALNKEVLREPSPDGSASFCGSGASALKAISTGNVSRMCPAENVPRNRAFVSPRPRPCPPAKSSKAWWEGCSTGSGSRPARRVGCYPRADSPNRRANAKAVCCWYGATRRLALPMGALQSTLGQRQPATQAWRQFIRRYARTSGERRLAEPQECSAIRVSKQKNFWPPRASATIVPRRWRYDLGIVFLRGGEANRALVILEEAQTMGRKLADRALELRANQPGPRAFGGWPARTCPEDIRGGRRLCS